jgi:hypothetical protein
MKFKIDQSDAQKIMDYLITKPFIEVQALVAILTKLEPVKEEPKPELKEAK